MSPQLTQTHSTENSEEPVIAIIAILASMLLPAVANAKRKAQGTKCLNNLKQLTLTISLSASDNNDVIPWPNWANANLRPGWLYAFDNSKTGTNRFDINKGLFLKIIESDKILRCPLEDRTVSTFTARAQQLSSYVMNGAACSYARQRQNVLLGDMRGDGVAFWEADERAPGFFNDASNQPNEGVSLRHGGSAYAGTYTGSVEQIGSNAWFQTAADTAKNPLWCAPDTANGR